MLNSTSRTSSSHPPPTTLPTAPLRSTSSRRTGTNERRPADLSASRFPTHLRKRFAFTPCAKASPDIDEPGRRHADTSRSFDAASYLRRPFRRIRVTRSPTSSNSIPAIASTIFHSGHNLASNHTIPKVQGNSRLPNSSRNIHLGRSRCCACEGIVASASKPECECWLLPREYMDRTPVFRLTCLLDKRFASRAESAVVQAAGTWRIRPRSRPVRAQRRCFSAQRAGWMC